MYVSHIFNIGTWYKLKYKGSRKTTYILGTYVWYLYYIQMMIVIVIDDTDSYLRRRISISYIVIVVGSSYTIEQSICQ